MLPKHNEGSDAYFAQLYLAVALKDLKTTSLGWVTQNYTDYKAVLAGVGAGAELGQKNTKNQKQKVKAEA